MSKNGLKEFVDKSADILEKLYKEFPKAGAWLTQAADSISKFGHVVSINGRVRNMWRVFTGRNGVIAAAQRRGKNSPIQGPASEIGTAGAYLTTLKCYEFLKEFGEEYGWDMDEMFPRYSRAVHDSALTAVPYPFILPYIHIRQYMATNGVTDWYKEKLGVDFTIEPEIELEVFASEDKSYKWDWELPNLLTSIYKALQDQVTLGQLEEDKFDETWDSVMMPWQNKKLRRILQERFPLLNVPDLDAEIRAAARGFKPPEVKKEKEAA